MNEFKKRNKFGGGEGRDGGFKKKFKSSGFRGGNKFGGNSGFKRDNMEMFSAVCASCGKNCEVPFRPNGKKPVYCKECFGQVEDRGGNDRYENKHSHGRDRDDRRPSFENNRERSEGRERAQEARPDKNIEEMKRQIEIMSIKLDKVMTMISEKAVKVDVKETVKESKKESVKPTKKKAAPAKAKPKKK